MYEMPIPAQLKRALRLGIPGPLWRYLKEIQRQAAFRGNGPFSFDEQAILRHVDAQRDITPFFVDIGAQDGVLGSQTLGLAKRGWAGVSYEADPELVRNMAARYKVMPAVQVRQELVTPDDICRVLERDGVPRDFGFLSLDIDSFDYFVLRSILLAFAPAVICVEINEMIPPPVAFAVEYRSGDMWAGDRFQGFSIQAAKELCNEFGYEVGELHYNNLILVRSRPGSAPVSDKDIERAYREGYAGKSDRRALFPWNDEFEHLQELPPQEVLDRLSRLFADRLDRCRLSLPREGGA